MFSMTPTLKFLDYESTPRRVFEFLLPVVVFFGLGIASELIIFESRSRKENIARQNAISNTAEIRAILESDLNSSIYLASGLVAFVKNKQGNFDSKEILPWLSDMQKQAHGIRNFSLAPGNRITTVAPLPGNESAVGLYLPDSPAQWPAVQRIMATRRPILAGPFELKQGGQGLVYRVPIFLDDGKYWGFISTVLDASELFYKAHQRALALDLDLLIIDTEADEKNRVIFGKNSLKMQADQSLKVNFPGRSILIYTQHRLPPKFDFLVLIARSIAWGGALILGWLIARIFRSYRRQTSTYSALDESQQRFISAFNTAPQGMALFKQSGEWMSVNPSLCEMLGYDAYTLLQQTPATLSHQLNIHRLEQQWEERQSAGLQFELCLTNSKAEVIPCIVSLSRVSHPSFDQCYWIFQAIDISRRVLAENRLHDAFEYTQSIVNNIDDGIISASLDGTIRSINPAALALWKLTPEQTNDLHFSTLLSSPSSLQIAIEVSDFIDAASHGRLPDNSQLTRESIVTDQQGRDLTIEFRISLIEQKKETEFLILAKDITQRKRAERLQQQFLEVAKHGLKPPLNSITGSLKLIEGGVFGTLPNSLGRIIHLALQHSEQATRLLSDMQDLQQLVSKKMEFQLQECKLDDIVQQAFTIHAHYTRQYQVQFQTDGELPDCIVLADARRLLQILGNLLSNAAKFSRPDGIVKVAINVDQHHANISVIDTGTGIPDSFQTRLIHLFEHKNPGQGLIDNQTPGLGLQICRLMLERMNGSIRFTSTEGEGSCFTISLPRA
ncbi:MAG: PAS domain S-box protein [Burkholderiales bacterium]|nr:PAS domain S-box protein [Burkholderiales bacterium]